MKLVNGLTYREWQQRNTLAFKVLSKDAQKEIRSKGYYNLGWERVKKSWELISESKVVRLIDRKLEKGDLKGAIELVNIESENTKKLASRTVCGIQETRQKLNEMRDSAIDKYSKV